MNGLRDGVGKCNRGTDEFGELLLLTDCCADCCLVETTGAFDAGKCVFVPALGDWLHGCKHIGLSENIGTSSCF